MNERPRKVFLVIRSLPWQGGNASIDLLAQALPRYGFTPYVFVHDPVGEQNQYLRALLRDQIPVYQGPIWQPPQWLHDRFGLVVTLAFPLRILGVVLNKLLRGRALSHSWHRFPARLEYFLLALAPRAAQAFFFGVA